MIATGGTAEAAAKLVEKSGGKVEGFVFVINLFDLGGIKLLENKGYNYNELLTPDTFINHPYFIWGWYASQYKLFHNAKPHEGYYLLKNYIPFFY